MIVVLHVSLDFFNYIIAGINAFCLQKLRDIHKELVVIIIQLFQRKDVIDYILNTVGGLWCFMLKVIIQDIAALSGKIVAVVFGICEREVGSFAHQFK